MIGNFPKTKLFCEMYWQKQKQELIQIGALNSRTRVRYHLLNVNKALIGASYDPMHFAQDMHPDLSKLIKESDIDFRCLKPTSHKMILWRGLSLPLEEWGLPAYIKDIFQKSMNLKKGDRIRLPGYIFATTKKELAEFHAYSTKKLKSIVYKINVPEGSFISCDYHHVFPRNSEFICTDSHTVDNETQLYQLISLDYVRRDLLQ